MSNKILTKRESIFIYVALAIVNILCIVKFMWSFFDVIDFIKIMELTNLKLDITDFKFIKVVQIISLCLNIGLVLSTSLYFFLKKDSHKRNALIVIISVFFLTIVFFFVNRFFTGNLISDNYIKEMANELMNDEYGDSEMFNMILSNKISETANLNMIYLIVSGIISVLMSFSIFNFNKGNNQEENSEDVIQVENNENVSDEEKSIQDEIKKLKNKIRIKNLEEEYLNLRAQLDKDKRE